jgi:DNA polymerase III subunit epsilon
MAGVQRGDSATAVEQTPSDAAANRLQGSRSSMEIRENLDVHDRPSASLRRAADRLGWRRGAPRRSRREEGFGCGQLAHLAMGYGLFFDGHRALHDCRAGIEILSRPLPRSGRTALAVLLESARSPRWRVWAKGAPYALRETLNRRGYRWNDGSDGSPRAWHIDVAEDTLETESVFLRSQVYHREDMSIDARHVTAFERYSRRC